MIVNIRSFHFAFLHVNYNNSELTINCINSILSNNENSKIIVIDNNSEDTEKEKLKDWKLKNQEKKSQVTFIFELKNLGYFGALNIGLESLKNDIHTFDYVTIGNNDLIFEAEYFKTLANIKITNDIFVLAPNIIKTNGVHQNPYSINRTSKIRKLLYYILYSNYFVARLMYLIADLLSIGKSNKDKTDFNQSQIIFAGHGACYILTKSYFRNNYLLDNSSFLMGEEFLFAKQIRDTKGKIMYVNNLKVMHDEHSTMKNIHSKVVYKYEQAAFKLFKDIC